MYGRRNPIAPNLPQRQLGRMQLSRTILGFGLLAATTASMAQSIIIDRNVGLMMGALYPGAGVMSSRVSGDGYRFAMPPKDSSVCIQMPSGTNWTGYTHIDLRLKNNGSTPAHIEMDCSSHGGGGWLTSNIVVAPGEVLNVSMPFARGADWGIRALPSITETIRSQTASFGSFFPDDVNGFFIWNKGIESADVTIESMELSVHNASPIGFVDTYGQQARFDWLGKVWSQNDLTNAKKNEKVESVLPYPADSYGGATGARKFAKADAFRTLKDGNHWYLVTPLGNRFFSMGVNEVGAQAWTPVQGREEMFTDLPALKAGFPTSWSIRDGLNGFIPYEVNLRRKYGVDWRSKTEALFLKRLKTWGFNTIGINSWDSMVSNQQIASTFGGPVVGNHKQFETYDGRQLHDVYDPKFVTDALATCQSRILETGGANPMNLGIFIDNELPWGNKYMTDSRFRYAIAAGAMRAVGTYTHTQLIQFLKQRYAKLRDLNTAWNTNYASWSVLNVAETADIPSATTEAMQTDLSAFGYQFAQKYFSTIKASLNSLGYKGLYLGCRFTAAEVVPEVVAAAKESCDVISVNVYHANPSAAIPELKTIDFPVLISEIAFGATDLGRVGVPLYPTQTEAARIDAYKRFMEEVKSWPNIVGAHWYRWEDFPATGKMDTDNMSEGLISIVDNPYAGFTEQTRKSTIDLMAYLIGIR